MQCAIGYPLEKLYGTNAKVQLRVPELSFAEPSRSSTTADCLVYRFCVETCTYAEAQLRCMANAPDCRATKFCMVNRHGCSHALRAGLSTRTSNAPCLTMSAVCRTSTCVSSRQVYVWRYTPWQKQQPRGQACLECAIVHAHCCSLPPSLYCLQRAQGAPGPGCELVLSLSPSRAWVPTLIVALPGGNKALYTSSQLSRSHACASTLQPWYPT